MHNREAEQSLIGCMLIDNDLIEQVSAIVTPEDFGDSVCRDLMYLIMAVRAKAMQVDVISLSLVRSNLSGGDDTIACAADIMRETPGTANWEACALKTKSLSQVRAYSKTLNSLVKAFDPNKPAEEQINNAQIQLARMAENSKQPEVRSAYDLIRGVRDDIVERMESGGAFKGLLAGYPDLDKLLCGLRGGHMVVIAGRPGSGKTTLGMNIAEHNAQANGTPSLVFSLEMSGKELGRRMLSSIGRIPLDLIDTGKVDDHVAHITTGVAKIKEMPIYVCDRGGIGIAQIRAIASFQKRMNKIQMIVIDYIGMIRTPGARNANRTQELGDVSRQCKELAKELDIPVIVLAQLNREIDKSDREPRLSDLRDSGEIEQDADIVAFVCKSQDEGISKIVVAKHRHAKPGTCYLMHRGELSRFESVSRGYEPKAQETSNVRVFK